MKHFDLTRNNMFSEQVERLAKIRNSQPEKRLITKFPITKVPKSLAKRERQLMRVDKS